MLTGAMYVDHSSSTVGCLGWPAPATPAASASRRAPWDPARHAVDQPQHAEAVGYLGHRDGRLLMGELSERGLLILPSWR
jgi:hypothetical protein